jgi:Right handed beta helix region
MKAQTRSETRGTETWVPRRKLALGLALAAVLLAMSSATAGASHATPQACVGGPHTGNITFSQEWCAAQNPHIVNGGVAVLAGVTLTIQPGVQVLFSPGSGLDVNGTLIAQGTPELAITLTSVSGNWSGVLANPGPHLRLAYCDVSNGGGSDWHYAVLVSSTDAQIAGCHIHDSAGDGLVLNAGPVTFRNLAVTDNAWYGVSMKPGGHVNGLHLTLARNYGGLNVESSSTAVLMNTILAGNSTGVNVASGGTASLSHTLWDNNTTPVVGTVNESGHFDGLAAFAADGYHITPYSAAIGRGLDAGVTDDLDGQARPRPTGTHPDLGADEDPGSYVYLPLVLFQFPEGPQQRTVIFEKERQPGGLESDGQTLPSRSL